MKIIHKWLSTVSCLFILSFSPIGFADTIATTYSFNSEAYGANQFLPELNFDGPVSGELTTKYNSNNNTHTIEELAINFASMPSISAKNFTKVDPQTYETHVSDAWIFRSVTVTLHFPDSIEFPRMVYADIFIDYSISFIGRNTHTTPPGTGPLLVSFPFEPEANRDFVTIDEYETTYMGKPVFLKLNKHLIRAVDQQNGWVREGFELNVTWYGHGEGTFIFDAPYDLQIKPVAIKQDNFAPEGEPEFIFIEFKDQDYTAATPPMALSDILHEAIIATNGPSFP